MDSLSKELSRERWYNTNHHGSTRITLYEAVYSVPLPRLTTYVIGTTKNDVADEELKSREHILSLLKHNLSLAQERMKKQYDKHRNEHHFSGG